jgi:cell division septation protein DedD
MNAVFRHMAVRLWITALGGGLICMALLPQWQRVLGLSMLYVPVVAVLSGCFLSVGWLMNRLGLSLVRRQVSEAAVWERAGMGAEAQSAFEGAKAVYDSFWLSPHQRRRCADWVAMRLARFNLAQATINRQDHAMVLSYLHAHPEDDAVALAWLEGALRRERHSSEEHEVAARVGQALDDNDRIQRLLLQFYLSDRRADFDAMQTYRRVWRQPGELPEALIRTLAQVLLNDSVINDWALEVYLRGYSLGDPHCLEGIAAGERLLSPNTDNRRDLAAAREILALLDETQRRKLIRPFELEAPAPVKIRNHKARHLPVTTPEQQAPAPIEIKDEWEDWDVEEIDAQAALCAKGNKRQGPSLLAVSANATRRGLMALAISAWHGLGRMLVFLKAYSVLAGRAWRGSRFSVPSVGRVVKANSISALKMWRQSVTMRRVCVYAATGAAVLVLAIAGWRAVGRTPELVATPTPAPSAEATPRPVTDPFTIQVAAYLKSEDAQRFVDRLKQQQIDAFWNKATSANRTWYQVKVSHFATRDDAQKYGEALKSKGLIDDFYVANYSK